MYPILADGDYGQQEPVWSSGCTNYHALFARNISVDWGLTHSRVSLIDTAWFDVVLYPKVAFSSGRS